MSRSEIKVALLQMLDHAEEAVDMIHNKTFENLGQLNLSIIRLLEIIGEAANRIPLKTREMYSDIQLGPIIGLKTDLFMDIDYVRNFL